MSYTLAVIGSGGKTTAIRQLAAKNAARRVLLTTTTHIYPINPPESRLLLEAPDAAALTAALQIPGIVCAGVPAMLGKLAALPQDVLCAGIAACDIALIEADGAHNLPLKLHKEDEPVMPEQVAHCLVVAGMRGFGLPAAGVCHRYQIKWKNSPERIVGCEEICICVQDAVSACKLPREKLTVLLSQTKTPQQLAAAQEIQKHLMAQGMDTRVWSYKNEIPFSLPV